MSFEMIGFGDTASSADLSFGIFFYLHNTYLQVRYVFYNFSLIAKLCRRILKALIRPQGVHVAFHDRRTDDLLCVLAFILFNSTFSRRIVSVSNKMQYFNVAPPAIQTREHNTRGLCQL
jgi:hypothetical protein